MEETKTEAMLATFLACCAGPAGGKAVGSVVGGIFVSSTLAESVGNLVVVLRLLVFVVRVFDDLFLVFVVLEEVVEE